LKTRHLFYVPLALAVLLGSACAGSARPQTGPSSASRESSASVLLHGKSLDLHVVAPRAPATSRVIVLYASGDGGWFGSAVDMFRQIAGAGYPTVGFSSRAFLKIERPRGALVTAAQLATEYEQIVAQARRTLGLDATSRVVLAGWSRGAAFSVLVGSEPAAHRDVLGVLAIGLDRGEDLAIDGAEDESDDGQAAPEGQRWPFDTYQRIAHLDAVPCAVIQATHDNYLPAARAQALFGPDTPMRRFYAIDAKNHRFSGGKAAFDSALLDALHWIAQQQPGP
jgi:hypothetical protein